MASAEEDDDAVAGPGQLKKVGADQEVSAVPGGVRLSGSAKLGCRRWTSPGHRALSKLIGEPQRGQKPRWTPGDDLWIARAPPDHSMAAAA